MDTIQIHTYKFHELSETAKTQAIEDYRNEKQDNNNLLFFYEDYCLEELERNGFKGDFKIYYSLGYSQGDGICFEGSFNLLDYLRVNKLLTRFKHIIEDPEATIKQQGSYFHYNSMDLYLGEFKEGSEELEKDLREIIEDHMKRLSGKLELEGYKQIEFELSDECIIEDLISNEYDFLDSGKRKFYV